MRHLGLVFTLFALGLPRVGLGAVTFQINYLDSSGEGFWDPTGATPVPSVPPNLGTTIGEQRRIAFEYALSIWAPHLESPVPIAIDAYFDPLTCDQYGAVLGSCGALTVHRDFANAPRAGTWYSQAIANSLAGTDLSIPPPTGTGYSDLRARFSSVLGTPTCPGFAWYYGLDRNHGTDINFVSVLLHEFAHGFGFQTFAAYSEHPLSGTWFNGYPDAYGRFLYDLDGTVHYWDAMTDAQRGASMINPRSLVWTGRLVHAGVGMLEMGIPLVRVNTPSGIAGSYDAGEAEFGPSLTTTGVTANVVLGWYRDGNKTKTDGCQPLSNTDASGKIVILDRGTCVFTDKVINAQAKGAVGVIIVDNEPGDPPGGLAGTDPGPPTGPITIPAVRVTQATGTSIKNNLSSGVNASLVRDGSRRAGTDTADRMLLWTPDPYEDGSSVSHFDIIARPNLLMEPYSNADEQHDPDLTVPLLRDMGWKCPGAAVPADAAIVTARFTSGTAKLEWLNGSTGGLQAPPPLRYLAGTTSPRGPTDGSEVACASFDGGANAYNSCTHAGLANGTTYSYRLFSTDNVCYSPGAATLVGAPIATTGSVKWAYASGASSLGPPGLEPGGIGSGAIYSAANNNILHAMNPSASGGDWPRSSPFSWRPFTMNGPVQHTPAVAPLAAGLRVYLASQDGYAYALDGNTGTEVWTSNSGGGDYRLGDNLQSSPVGFFSDFYPGGPDLLFVGTRNPTAANALVALSPATGTVVPAKTFSSGELGIVTGAMVSYGDWKVYFTSYRRDADSTDSVWCVDVSGTTVTKAWSKTLTTGSGAAQDVDGAPVVYQGLVYVGTTDGWVHVLDAANGNGLWSWDSGTGEPIKGYVLPHYGRSPVRVYVATSNAVSAVDYGAAATVKAWNIAATGASVPLLRYDTGTLYFGDASGRLHTVNTVTGSESTFSVGSSALGAPAFDYLSNMIHVGSTAGIIYGVAVP